MSASDEPEDLARQATPPAGGSTIVDVGSILASSEVTIRPQEDPADANLRRFKERVRFIIAWGVVLVVGAVALEPGAATAAVTGTLGRRPVSNARRRI